MNFPSTVLSADGPVIVQKVDDKEEPKADENKAKYFRFKAKNEDEEKGSEDPLDSDDNVADANVFNFSQKKGDKKQSNPLVEDNEMTPDQLAKFKTADMPTDDVAQEANVDTEMSANPEAHSSMGDDMGATERFRFRQIKKGRHELLLH